jgi:photosystem II stability/assembly factor-like uncharacterized protein
LSDTGWSNLITLATLVDFLISDLFVQPSNLNRMWMTYSNPNGGSVYRSDNGGGTWMNCTASLRLPVHTLAVDDANPDRVWIGADVGVYQSIDAGATWTPLANGLPNVYVGDLAFHAHSRRLRAATASRGVWEIDIDSRGTARE